MDYCYTLIYQVDTFKYPHQETLLTGEYLLPKDEKISDYLDNLEYEVPSKVVEHLFTRIESYL